MVPVCMMTVCLTGQGVDGGLNCLDEQLRKKYCGE
jgi:hypothetical protein